MKFANVEVVKPYGARDFAFIRAGPDGACWRAPDGFVVRVAAREHMRGCETAQEASLPI